MDYTQEQLDAAAAREPQVLVRALAGTGKTETVALRIETLIKEGIPQEEILCLCFTNAAVGQLSRRLESKGFFSVKVKTIDAYAYTIVAPWAEKKRIDLTITNGEAIAKKLLLKYGVGCTKSDVKNFLQMSKLRWFGLPLNLTIAGIQAKEIDKALEDFDAIKRKEKLVEFTDLLVMATSLPSKKYTEVIIDEAQDATTAHLRFIETLVGERLTLVGDSYQSIFNFSGVDPELFNKYCAGWPTYSLTKSFRSNSTVLSIVNSVFQEGINLTTDSDAVGEIFKSSEVEEVLEQVLKAKGSKVLLFRRKRDSDIVIPFLEESGFNISKSWEGVSLDEDSLYAATIHYAKGLEWDNVAVFNLNKMAFLGSTPIDIATEKRLAYVAASRARKNLFLHGINGEYPYRSDNNGGV